MKKRLITVIAIMSLALLGTACHKQTDSSKESVQSSKITKKKSDTKKQSSKKSSSSGQQSNSSEQSSSSSKSQSQSSSSAVQDRLSMITTALRQALPGEKFPQTGINGNVATLSSRYTGNQQNYVVYYYTSGDVVDFNDDRLVNRQASLTLQKITYSSVSAAQNAIDYREPASGLPKVDLGTDIFATKEGAAGSTYLNWTEGRWSLVTRASSVNNEVGEPLAKKVVALLHTKMLPIPDQHGAINLYVSSSAASRMNTVSWSKGNAVYTISAVDPIMAIEAAISLE